MPGAGAIHPINGTLAPHSQQARAASILSSIIVISVSGSRSRNPNLLRRSTVTASVTNGLALRYAGGSARGLLHNHPGHCRGEGGGVALEDRPQRGHRAGLPAVEEPSMRGEAALIRKSLPNGPFLLLRKRAAGIVREIADATSRNMENTKTTNSAISRSMELLEL